MRFLCLHGGGTNSQVLETQTAALRYELQQSHEFDFVEGTLEYTIAPEIKSFYPPDDKYFSYFTYDSPESVRTALSNLASFIELEGPYDAVLAFSHGASLASTFILQRLINSPSSPLPFKCAVFLSGVAPLNPRALERGEIRFVNEPEDGLPLLSLPTAHAWDNADTVSAGAGNALWNLSEKDERWRFLHTEGHDIPSARARDAVMDTVGIIQRAVDRSVIAV